MNRSHEHGRGLLQKAREDERAMILLVENASSADWIAGFHAQQAVVRRTLSWAVDLLEAAGESS